VRAKLKATKSIVTLTFNSIEKNLNAVFWCKKPIFILNEKKTRTKINSTSTFIGGPVQYARNFYF
jgi:hypothetical protein